MWGLLWGVVQLIRHYEKHNVTANVQICALCCNPYITKAALDCHLTHNHGGIEGACCDYERKYKPSVVNIESVSKNIVHFANTRGEGYKSRQKITMRLT